MVEIDFINETQIDMVEWENFAQTILDKGKAILNIKEDINLSITFLDEQAALEINKEYRNKSYIPDVTSFPVEMSEAEVAALGFREIGDIFICLEEAQRKTIKYDHTIEQEMGFLFVHGFLHLLGYDHEDSLEEEKKMFDLQDQILLANNINYTIKFTEEDYLEEEKNG
ncbi:rRNA maturation RNase YbeY [[Acholeplasma] multilocale]|uniref:rRNA maturation RNase YbeY n=1 Tax=[Acholeplasma] multilocale TaxID=264638 RepID=UPI00047B36C2|nr:rRNA maturation RNase YbeY [[Acholeplasma] multilocale]